MNLSFGGRRVRRKKGRGAGGEAVVFGILERHGKVYTEIVPNAAKKVPPAAIRGRVAIDSIISLGRLEGLRWTVWIGGTESISVVNHGQHGFARGNCPIDGIGSFWSYAK